MHVEKWQKMVGIGDGTERGSLGIGKRMVVKQSHRSAHHGAQTGKCEFDALQIASGMYC